MSSTAQSFLILLVMGAAASLAPATSGLLASISVDTISLRPSTKALLLEPPLAVSVRRDELDLDLHPFCKKRERDTGPFEDENCAAWEEQEVDMILMLLDLLAEGVPGHVAADFYTEIRCLSRTNLFFNDEKKIFMVCFDKDYSRVVGQLLVKYVRPVFDELDTFSPDNALAPSVRFFDEHPMALNVTVRDADVNNIFAGLSAQEQQRLTLATSCCRACSSGSYFVNYQINMCVKNPTGNHCCHKVCGSLNRLKIGMSNSVGYCCPDLYPQSCIP